MELEKLIQGGGNQKGEILRKKGFEADFKDRKWQKWGFQGTDEHEYL